MFHLDGNRLQILSRENVTTQILKFRTKIKVWRAILQRGVTLLYIVEGTIAILNDLLRTAHYLCFQG